MSILTTRYQKSFEEEDFDIPKRVLPFYPLKIGTIKSVKVFIAEASVSGDTVFQLDRIGSGTIIPGVDLTIPVGETEITKGGLDIAIAPGQELILELITVPADEVKSPIGIEIEVDEGTDQQIRDIVDALLSAGANITFNKTYSDDPANTIIESIEVESSGGGGGGVVGIPIGGTTGQHLSKVDGTDYNVEWDDPPSPGGGGGGEIGPDSIPSSPDAMDDEFTGSSLDAKWTTIFRPSEIAMNSRGKGVIFTMPLDSSAGLFTSIFQALPGSGDWAFRTKLGFTPNWQQYIYPGLFMRESGTNKLSGVVYYSNGNALQGKVAHSTAPNHTTSGQNPVAATWLDYNDAVVYFEVEKISSTLYYRFSPDGIQFTTITSKALTDNFTTGPNQVGICGMNYNKAFKLSALWFRKVA